MVLNYYPGCTLKTKAKVLDKYARKGTGTTAEREQIAKGLKEIDVEFRKSVSKLGDI